DPDDAYFALSIHEEILNQLVKIQALNVIARTSVMQYAEARPPIPQIAEELNVGAVVECSVRYAGDAILVSIAGMRDARLMHTAQAAASLTDVEALQASLPGIRADGPLAFEALYEVTGFGRVSLDAMLVYTGTLDYQKIWGGELP
ncbi:MAG: hypothetical protein O6930_08490, partial [Gammaproteobacteria bacterium]|nr:hypothetical protein [Gammaproteobacteria bacterium]